MTTTLSNYSTRSVGTKVVFLKLYSQHSNLETFFHSYINVVRTNKDMETVIFRFLKSTQRPFSDIPMFSISIFDVLKTTRSFIMFTLIFR
jgi:hypothetical protein